MKTFINFLNNLFAISVATFVIAAILMILVQSFALTTLNGALAVSISQLIIKIAGPISAIAPIVSIILGYIVKEEATSEDNI